MKTSTWFLCSAALFALNGGDPGLRAARPEPLPSPPAKFDLVREGEGFTVRVLQPVIPVARLTWLGLAGESPENGATKIPCWLEVNGSGRRPVDVTVQSAGGYLQSFTLPAIFYDLLGRQNIATILRLAEGVSLPNWTIDSVTPTMIQTVLTAHNLTSDPDAGLVTLQLSPRTAGMRSLVVKIKRLAPQEDYKEIAVSLRK